MAPLRFLRALYCVDADYKPLHGRRGHRPRLPGDGRRLGALRGRAPGAVQGHGVRRSPVPAGPAAQQGDAQRARLRRAGLDPEARRARSTGCSGVYGSHKRFPIYDTEFGYQTTPPDTQAGTREPRRRGGVAQLVGVSALAQSADRLL